MIIALIALAVAFYGFFRHVSPMLFGLDDRRCRAWRGIIVDPCSAVYFDGYAYIILSFFFPDPMLAMLS
jgi:hypothetical protein